MSGERIYSRGVGLAIFAGCLVASASWCLTAGSKIGATFDEPVYMRAGLDSWRTGSTQELMHIGTMPLPIDVTTFPVWVWEECRGEPFNTWTDYDRIMPVARCGTLLFWAVLLIYVRKIGADLGGVWCGRICLMAIAFEPNLLGHACLATTDVALTACVLACLYHFQQNREAGWWRRVGLAGVLYGVALLAKASAMLFVPLCMLIIEARRQWLIARAAGHSPFRIGWTRGFAWELFQIGWIGVFLTFLYCGSDWRVEPTFVEWAETLPAGGERDAMLWFAENTAIFSNAGNALARQILHNFRGHGVYLLGESHPRAVWYYFPAALSMKLTVPTIVALASALLFAPRRLRSWAGLCALGLLLASLNCRVQIGVRLVFPLLVLLHIAAITALSRLYGSLGESAVLRRRAMIGGAVVGLAWHGYAALATWPHGIAYFNEFWGGRERGHLLLSDSNLDWGQGFRELESWRLEHGEPEMFGWFFGADPKYLMIGIPEAPVHQWPIASTKELAGVIQGRPLAVSKTVLYGCYVNQPNIAPILADLRSREPIGETTSFFIFAFPEYSPPAIPPGGAPR